MLSANAEIFKGQGKALNDYADANCKVLVVGNPANTNALIASLNAPKIPSENFTALTRLDQNRAIFQVAERLNVPVHTVKNTIIWGNHSATQYPDVSFGLLSSTPQVPLQSAINDQKWLEGSFIKDVALRGAEIIKARKLSSAASAANAACDHIHDWIIGTKPVQKK